MARWLLTFGVLMALSTTLWPWLRQLGLARLPGDLAVDFIPGLSFHLPITTSLLISGVIAGVWDPVRPLIGPSVRARPPRRQPRPFRRSGDCRV
jgi:hypothetical protein